MRLTVRRAKREDCQVEGPSGSPARRRRRRGVCGGVLGVSSGGAGEGDRVREGVEEETGERVGAEGVGGETGQGRE